MSAPAGDFASGYFGSIVVFIFSQASSGSRSKSYCHTLLIIRLTTKRLKVQFQLGYDLTSSRMQALGLFDPTA